MSAHIYKPIYREPNFATVPRGWSLVCRGPLAKNYMGREDLPLSAKYPFGLISYPEKLDSPELWDLGYMGEHVQGESGWWL